MKKNIIKSAAYFLKEASPTLFAIAACGGVAATAIFSAKATSKATQILRTDDELRLDIRSKEESVKKVWKLYIPTAISGTLTITSIILSNRLSKRQLAALTATCAYITANRDALEAKLKEAVGEEKLRKIKREIESKASEKSKVVCTAGPSVEDTGRGDLLCFEGYSGRWFRSSEYDVKKAVKTINEWFDNGSSVCLNDFYDLLGIEKTHFGQQYGWTRNPDYYDGPISIETQILEGWIDGAGRPINEDVLAIDVYTYPMYGWDEL